MTRLRALRSATLSTLALALSNFAVGCDQGVPEEDAASAPVAQATQALHGPRLGDPLPGLTPDQRKLFFLGEAEFVREMLPRDGLGPVFIERACVTCHALGGIGGADPGVDPNHFVRRFATFTMGAYDPLAALGGDVLQTRSIAPLQPFCNVAPEVVPPQATIVARRNPLQVFGTGLIDAIPDAAILAGAVDRGDGVRGRPNLDPNGRPGRFGWKAQGNTLLAFSAVAANGTMGMTTPQQPNEPRPQGQDIPPGCTNADVGATSPNDATGAFIVNTTAWQALLAPPTPLPLDHETARGKRLFLDIGCAKCHTPELRTGNYSVQLVNGTTVPVEALSNKTAALYSDLLLHDMGPGLDEKIVMRQAQGSEFRTAPLWGLRVRRRLLHDGRATTVHEAIVAHGGQAQIIRNRYLALRDWDQLALRRFLRSL
jgi:CxxC motif-containing protein (DUF1111 family)